MVALTVVCLIVLSVVDVIYKIVIDIRLNNQQSNLNTLYSILDTIKNTLLVFHRVLLTSNFYL